MKLVISSKVILFTDNMALTSILPPSTNPAVFLFNRGNIGVLVDVQAKAYNMLYLPEVTGGGGGEHSYTF